MNHKKEVSDAWKYFSKLREKENSHKARCNICLTLISHHGNTTNLLKHIKRKHSANSVLEQNTQNESTTNNTLREDSTSSNDVSRYIYLVNNIFLKSYLTNKIYVFYIFKQNIFQQK